MNSKAEDTRIDERFLVTELITKENAKAIKELANAVKELSKIVAQEDNKMRETIQELVAISKDYENRYVLILDKFETKRDRLNKLEKEMSKKADKETVDAIRSIMIKIALGVLGAVGTVVMGAIVYVLKSQGAG